MPISVGGYNQGPTCWDKIKHGFFMGSCVGVAMGALLGGIHFFRGGYRGVELLEGLGKTMVQAGGSFGVFMAIGSGIRC